MRIAGAESAQTVREPRPPAHVGWEHFPHQADIGVRGFGPHPEVAFEQAARALAAAICDPDLVEPREDVRVEVTAPDRELLLVDWLNALIYEMATRNLLLAHFAVHIEGDHLVGHAWGERVDPARHQPAVEPKGATFTALRVARDEESGAWIAQCVVDV